MGKIINEGLEFIGRIDDEGYVFDKSGDCVARIDQSGYVSKLAGSDILGKIDRDGTIRDSYGQVCGNVQADGYLYIHSQRVCRVDSKFIRSITPDAWNYGHPTTYPNRVESTVVDSGYRERRKWPFGFGTTLKLLIGLALGIYAIIVMGGELGLLGCIIAIPFMIAMVFLLCFVIGFISGIG